MKGLGEAGGVQGQGMKALDAVLGHTLRHHPAGWDVGGKAVKGCEVV